MRAGALPQLKGGDAEYPLQPQRRDRAGIHAHRFEYWREPQVLRQGDRVAVDAGNVKEDLAAARAGQQSRQNHLGGGAVVGYQCRMGLSLWERETPPPPGTKGSAVSVADKRIRNIWGK